MCLKRIKERITKYKTDHGVRNDVSACPDCGSERTYTTGQFRPLGILVTCKNCGLRGPLAQSREQAILLWNDMVCEKQK